jgi:hypothetical protein
MAWTAVVVVIFSLVLVIGAIIGSRGQRLCLRCGGPTRSVALPAEMNAEACWCEACSAPTLLAFGRRGAPARCPQCHQRALVLRATVDDGEWWVEAGCGLCTYTDAHLIPVPRELEDAARAPVGRVPRGIVVPFPSPNEAARRRTDLKVRSGPHGG